MDVRALCRKTAAEGAVLLKNDGDLLPLANGTKLAVFGRAQTFYYKSGTGSGGLVHIDNEPCTIDSLKACPKLIPDAELIGIYNAWVQKHPFRDGGGRWGGEPWFQEEMPLEDEVVCAAATRNNVALIMLARTAGEDHDNADKEGSYRLTAEEEAMLRVVTAHFSRVIVALNVGNVIDTTFIERYPISSLLYLWQGGMEGANALADLLCGDEAPNGRLTDTIAYHLADHPSHAHFGNKRKNIYAEDIYVGYRYFETFHPEAVQFPFGFGLGYTTFDTHYEASEDGDDVVVTATVTNIGDHRGKDVAQIYVQAPCGKLGTPTRQLVGFAKTQELGPGETERLTVRFSLESVAAYDDGGITGHRSCYVLEEGDYRIFAGADVRSATAILTCSLPSLKVVKELEPILPPSEAFDRLVAEEDGGRRREATRPVPVNAVDLERRIRERRSTYPPYSGKRGILLEDVAAGNHELSAFICQMTNEDLAALCCGEGMNSPKATPGTGGAFGGQTEELATLGIPVCAVTDGPSGIRLDDGTKATAIPNGTLLACTWDIGLVEEVYRHIGAELKAHRVDSLLGPGVNLHRHPLCGRNFEYFSEDPLLSGMMGAAVTRGVAAHGAFATIKHLCCNNQETARHRTEAIVSERALRELYLRPFEIALKGGKDTAVMTAYNPVNGWWAASNYDLIATVLRREWGFDGLVMTDWWACCNLKRGRHRSRSKLQGMIRAEGDVYMVCFHAPLKARSILRGLKSGYITREDLCVRAETVCRRILQTNTFKAVDAANDDAALTFDDKAAATRLSLRAPAPDAPHTVHLTSGTVKVELTVKSHAHALAQSPVTVHIGDTAVTVSVGGTRRPVTLTRLTSLNKDGDVAVSVSHSSAVKVLRLTLLQ